MQVNIHGYTEKILFNPPVSVFAGNQYLGLVKPYEVVSVDNVAKGEVFTFEFQGRSVQCAATDSNIVLSWNRMTGKLSANACDNVVETRLANASNDRSRIRLLILLIILGITLYFCGKMLQEYVEVGLL